MKEENFFSQDLNHSPLEPKASVLRMFYTDSLFVLNSDGTFKNMTSYAQCVRKNTCRQPFFPTHPGYAINDSARVFYSYGENIEMKCSDSNLVAEGAHIFKKETFSVLCAGPDKANPVFIDPGSWPRCIPRGCVDTYEDEVKSMGTCHCEFNECQEYIFNLVSRRKRRGRKTRTFFRVGRILMLPGVF